MQKYNISIITENSFGKPCPKCLKAFKTKKQEKITPKCFGVIVLSLISADPLVPVGILFYAPWVFISWSSYFKLSLFYSASSFSLSRRPFSCSTMEMEVTSRNPLNFLSLNLLLLHLSLPPFLLSQRCVPFFSLLIQFYKYLLGTCYVPGTISGS